MIKISNFSKYSVHATVKSNSKRDWTYDITLNFTQCSISVETFDGNCCCKDKHENNGKNKSIFCWHIILVLYECIDNAYEEEIAAAKNDRNENGMIIDSEVEEEEQEETAEEYVVERILGKRIYEGKQQYLIKWMGYDVKSATWENEENIKNAKDCLTYYLYLLNNGKIHYVQREQAN